MVIWLNQKERLKIFSHAVLLLTKICEILTLFSPFRIVSMYAGIVDCENLFPRIPRIR
jgi:hypothetical protein